MQIPQPTIDGLVQERRNYSALAMGYVFPAQTHRYVTKQRLPFLTLKTQGSDHEFFMVMV